MESEIAERMYEIFEDIQSAIKSSLSSAADPTFEITTPEVIRLQDHLNDIVDQLLGFSDSADARDTTIRNSCSQIQKKQDLSTPHSNKSRMDIEECNNSDERDQIRAPKKNRHAVDSSSGASSDEEEEYFRKFSQIQQSQNYYYSNSSVNGTGSGQGRPSIGFSKVQVEFIKKYFEENYFPSNRNKLQIVKYCAERLQLSFHSVYSFIRVHSRIQKQKRKSHNSCSSSRIADVEGEIDANDDDEDDNIDDDEFGEGNRYQRSKRDSQSMGARSTTTSKLKGSQSVASTSTSDNVKIFHDDDSSSEDEVDGMIYNDFDEDLISKLMNKYQKKKDYNYHKSSISSSMGVMKNSGNNSNSNSSSQQGGEAQKVIRFFSEEGSHGKSEKIINVHRFERYDIMDKSDTLTAAES